MTIVLNLVDEDVIVNVSDSAVNAALVVRAEAAADRAEEAQRIAELAAITQPGVYDSTVDGLAAVAEGETFWVSGAAGELLLYREESGVAVLEATLAQSLAYLPDQDIYTGSMDVGDGLRNLAHTTGEQGQGNTAVGIGAGVDLSSGYYNTLIGRDAGKSLDAHDSANAAPYAGAVLGNVGNTFIGWSCAPVAEGALDNTLVGTNVGLNLTNGMDNAGVGINALRDIEGGSENAAFGHGSLQHLVGSGVDYATGVGHRNTAVGDMAGRFINGGLSNKTGGKGSCYIGARTTSSGNAVVNENVFGYAAAGAGTNTCVYGNADITEHRFPGGVILAPDHVTIAATPNAYIDSTTGELKRATTSALAASVLDTDTTLAANSDAKVATQKATKAYVDAAVTGLWDFKGVTDCSTNPNYPAASKGDAYAVTVAGKIGGASGKSVDIGDIYLAIADNAGGTEASVGASWSVLEHNLVGALLAGNNLSDLTNVSSAQTNLSLVPGTNVFKQRTITGTANEVTVADGDGVSANPTLSLPAALTFTSKTVTGGTFSSITLSGATTLPGTGTITSGGNMGLGIASPSGRLHILSSGAGAGLDGVFVGRTDSTAVVTHTSRFLTQQQGSGLGRTLFYAASPTTGLTGGEFDILTENGGAFLMQLGTQLSGDVIAEFPNLAGTSRVRLNTNGASYLNGGNVGINEASPDYKLDVNGTFGFTPGSSVTPVDNGDVVFELTNNTTLTVRAKGSDGTVRSGTITLA